MLSVCLCLGTAFLNLMHISVNFSALLAFVSGHGFISKPPARNAAANSKNHWTPQAGNSAGVADRIKDKGASFPDNYVGANQTHGLCGDPWEGGVSILPSPRLQPHMQQGAPTTIYRKGENIEIEIEVTAHHWGHFEFRICKGGLNGDKFSTQIDGQKCLNENLLLRPSPDDREECKNAKRIDASNYDCQPIDTNHPERWYLPPQSFGSDGMMNYKMLFKLPDDLTCDVCTIQWNWITGNSCLVDGYKEYFIKFSKYFEGTPWDESKSPLSPCGSDTIGEQFWNCADVAIH
ncbi:hypothetical protein FOL47_003136 [Perkinsus chesapeaki]|uniref:Chitin-binding type-4 domain-containing protein n=1 Tax=Perkinsus chesapeaki TaxID=330153 RepID=A0A7J6M9G4_PERCH|nr:hypothetical protein FOL47_003136 [Perkinsus chesapeaki]